MRIIYETENQMYVWKHRENFRTYISKMEVSIMWRSVTKIVAVVALVAIVAGSSSNVAFAHHGRGHRAVVQNPTPVCYADGSCDVDGVCIFGVDCDGTVHHTETYYYGGTGHHSGHH